jgi:hypothetical protein
VIPQAPAGFRLFDHEAESGITTFRRFNYNERNPDQSTSDYVTHQDVEPILEANKREKFNAKGKVCEKDRIGFKVARIPITIQYKWLVEEGWDCLSSDPDCQKKLRQKLNDPEWCHLRVAELVL